MVYWKPKTTWIRLSWNTYRPWSTNAVRDQSLSADWSSPILRLSPCILPFSSLLSDIISEVRSWSETDLLSQTTIRCWKLTRDWYYRILAPAREVIRYEKHVVDEGVFRKTLSKGESRPELNVAWHDLFRCGRSCKRRFIRSRSPAKLFRI